MWFDGGLRRIGVFTPHHGDLGAGFGELVGDARERDEDLRAGDVPDVVRDSDIAAIDQHPVDLVQPVPCFRQVDVLGRQARSHE